MMNKGCDITSAGDFPMKDNYPAKGELKAIAIAACLDNEERLFQAKFANLVLTQHRAWKDEIKAQHGLTLKAGFKDECLKFKEKTLKEMAKVVNEKIKRRCGGEQDFIKTCFNQDHLVCRFLRKQVIEFPKFNFESGMEFVVEKTNP